MLTVTDILRLTPSSLVNPRIQAIMRTAFKPVEVDLFQFTGTKENLAELEAWLSQWDTPDNKVGENWIRTKDKIKINVPDGFGTGKLVAQEGDIVVRFPNGTFLPFPKEYNDMLFVVDDGDDSEETDEPAPITFSPGRKS